VLAHAFPALVRRSAATLVCALLLACLARYAPAQEKPYFVTYSHDLEEPGNLDIESKTDLGKPDASTHFGAEATEFEYGVRAWWTSELYLEGQTTPADSTLFTGFRIENRIRPILRELPVNPVLYVEYENISDADKTLLEVVGHDSQSDLAIPNATARRTMQHEAETRLILSSNLRDWNFSENFIAEKNLGHHPWEFGYALGATRPLATAASPHPCSLCLDKFIAGAELYGGLGDTRSLTLADTSHYLAPLLGWQAPQSIRLSFSPGFGLTSTSLNRVYRFGLAYEFDQFGSRLFASKGGVR
jgi:hypothetical protein